jgi:hypothetical protein
MGLRFRKSIGILPGFRLNISKSGPSVTVGGKGLTFNMGPKGPRATASLPGTGLSYVAANAPIRSRAGRLAFWIVVAAAALAVKFLLATPG